MSFRKKGREVPVINQAYYNKRTKESLREQRKRKALIRRLVAFFIVAGATTFLVLNTMRNQQKLLDEKEKQLEQLKTEYNKIEEMQQFLQEEIIKLQDEEYIGKYARQELFLSDDGEIIFSIPDEEDGEDSD